MSDFENNQGAQNSNMTRYRTSETSISSSSSTSSSFSQDAPQWVLTAHARNSEVDHWKSSEVTPEVDIELDSEQPDGHGASVTDKDEQRAGSVADDASVTDNEIGGSRIVVPQAASAATPEDLAEQYAYDDVVAALVRWKCDEWAAHHGGEFTPQPCNVEEALFRRSACIHAAVQSLDVASKRQVLASMRMQPHTHDAVLPWLGVTVGQACAFLLMSKGHPPYSTSADAYQRADAIFSSMSQTQVSRDGKSA